MAKKLNFSKIRQDRAIKIDLLGEILRSKNIIGDIGPLSQASSICRSKTENDNRWGYYLRNLDFGKIEDAHHVRPIKTQNIRVYISIKLEGICYPNNDYADPFENLGFNILIEGRFSSQEFFCCWHLDRHNSGENNSEVTEVHPRYHFQFGGDQILNRIDEVGIDFGRSLFLDQPRVMHPPLDIILGVDFVLSNFYGDKWRELCANPHYRSLVIDAQEKFWKPYIISLAANWSNLINSGWGSKDICPQLIS